MSFIVSGLPYGPFASLFDLDEAALGAHGARRLVVEEKPGSPCRVSLVDAEVGETVILMPYTHHDVASPYRASGPIFVRKDAEAARPAPGEIPQMLNRRLLSIRAYDAGAMMVAAEVQHGADLRSTIGRLFARQDVAYLHVHNAGPGCYNCAVLRA